MSDQDKICFREMVGEDARMERSQDLCVGETLENIYFHAQVH